MSLKTKRLTPAKLRAYEAKRDLAAELLESVRQMKAGKAARVTKFVANEVASASACLAFKTS